MICVVVQLSTEVDGKSAGLVRRGTLKRSLCKASVIVDEAIRQRQFLVEGPLRTENIAQGRKLSSRCVVACLFPKILHFYPLSS